ncbi:hypothetical protein NUW58_g959 [Xylaria curta]|uniref:Uncharacterized protein n=1 Tax=Xylaria curta TaxID=42375 RepID=A0ACC1PQ06_9PEZI|nr:hypothetical protein NUW58_g959 [Xylaria curta]
MNYEDDKERDALSCASKLGDINTARILLRGHLVIIEDTLERYKDSELDRKQATNDQHLTTPLSCVIKSGNPAAVQVSIRSAWKNLFNHYHTDESALHLSINENQGDIVDVLLKNGQLGPNFKRSRAVDSPPLVCTVRPRSEPIFENILNSEKVDADWTAPENRTALWWAAALGLDSDVEKLLDSRKVHRPYIEGTNGDTALSIAVESGHLGVIRQLLRVQEAASVSLKGDLRCC